MDKTFFKVTDFKEYYCYGLNTQLYTETLSIHETTQTQSKACELSLGLNKDFDQIGVAYYSFVYRYYTIYSVYLLKKAVPSS